MPTPYMPLELVSLIFDQIVQEAAASSDKRDPYNKTVTTFAIVCKAWHPIVLDVVFRDVTIDLESMTATVPRLLARPDLLARIRTIRVKPRSNKLALETYEDWHRTLSSSPYFDGLVTLLRAVPLLKHLKIPDWTPIASLVTAASAGAATVTLRPLEVFILLPSDATEYELSDLGTAMRHLGGLTSVRLHFTFDRPVVVSFRPFGTSVRLASLLLQGVLRNLPIGTSNFILSVVDLASLRTLTLAFGDNPSDDSLGLAGHCTMLQHLRLYAEQPDDVCRLLLVERDVLQGLRHLTDLTIGSSRGKAYRPEPRPISLEVFAKSLPSIPNIKITQGFLFDFAPAADKTPARRYGP